METKPVLIGLAPFSGVLRANFLILVGRALLAAPFILFGTQKFLHLQYMKDYIERGGLPGGVIWVVIPLQLFGGLAILAGWHTRLAAFLLGGFSMVATVIYHNNWYLVGESAQFMKDFAMAGGFLLLWTFGPGELSIDAWSLDRRWRSDAADAP